MDPAEELPSMLWGLDPIFSAFARLHVTDIFQMRESCQVPDIYFYKSHPIHKVDVLGTVVYKREREDFFCYGVDDGTGVINCLCWKNGPMKEELDSVLQGPYRACFRCFSPSTRVVQMVSSAPDKDPDHLNQVVIAPCSHNPKSSMPIDRGKPSDDLQHSFNLAVEVKKMKQAQQTHFRLEIGELLRVRGQVKTSRQTREIMASTYYKVNDPVMAVQIEWMIAVLQLYREFYDKPLHLQNISARESPISSLSKATQIIKDFLEQRAVSKFRLYDIEDILQPLFPSCPEIAPAGQEPVAGPSTCQQLHVLLKEALQLLQDEGVVYRKVTAQDKDLLMAVKDIIREDSKREKYQEKGCHILHILSSVRQRHSVNVSKAVLELVLKSLEGNSDIISTRENYFTYFII